MEYRNYSLETIGQEPASLRRDLVISAALCVLLMVPLFLVETATWHSLAMDSNIILTCLSLTLLIQIFAGRRFYKIAADSFMTGDIGVVALVAPVSLGAYVLSVYSGFFLPSDIRLAQSIELCLCAAITPTLALLGQYLEAIASKRVSEYIEKLSRPAEAGRESGVLSKPPAPGDILTVHPREVIPADGEVTGGFSSVDESILTGVSQPIDRQTGDRVILGSVNLYGTFDMLVKRTGPRTAYASMLRMIEDARDGISPFLAPSATVSRVYAPVAVFACVVTFVVWWLAEGSFYPALTASVLALASACPFALGFAARTSTVGGTARAAENGIIFKRNGRLKHFCGHGTIVLEESGVVTAGRPEVADLTALPGFFDEEVLTFAAAVAKKSRQPFAAAIIEYCQPKVITGGLEENVVRAGNSEFVALRSERHGFVGSALPRAEKFEELPGRGVRATVGGREVLVGTRELLRERGVNAREQFSGDSGKIAIYVAINGKAAGIITVRDEPREDARAAVEKLKHMGLRVCMMSGGDAQASAAAAKEAGIGAVITELPASDKRRGVAVVCAEPGAATHKSADTLISAGAGDFYEVADVSIIRSGLEVLPEAVGLVRTIFRKLGQNIFLALFFNVIAMVSSAFGKFSPLFLVASMMLALVSVTANSRSV